MIAAFFDDRAGQAAVAVFVVGLLRFLLDQAAQVRDHTFSIDGLTDWLRVHFMGVVLPIWLLLFLGWQAQDLALIGPTLLLAGVTWSGIYVAETIKDILDTWMPKHDTGPTGPTA